jgi:hypothetical protein
MSNWTDGTSKRCRTKLSLLVEPKPSLFVGVRTLKTCKCQTTLKDNTLKRMNRSEGQVVLVKFKNTLCLIAEKIQEKCKMKALESHI